jgi:beta-lactam-binding protein with PASTA domain
MRLKGTAIFLVSILGIFVLGVVLFNFVLMPLLIHQYNTVIVPDVLGVSEKQAVRFTDRVSLKLKVIRSEHNSEVPAGYVISQSPRANDNIKEGRTVSVVLSLGQKMQRVPELKGLSLRQGRIMLKRNKLRIGRVARILTEGDAAELLTASTPAAGHELAEGEAVDVLVSVGGKKRSLLMPDLSGQDLLFIKEKLERLGFRVSSVRYEYQKGTYPNTIIDQSPVPGAQIREGDSIELVAATTD